MKFWMTGEDTDSYRALRWNDASPPRLAIEVSTSSAFNPQFLRRDSTRALVFSIEIFGFRNINTEGPAPLRATPRTPSSGSNVSSAGRRGHNSARYGW